MLNSMITEPDAIDEAWYAAGFLTLSYPGPLVVIKRYLRTPDCTIETQIAPRSEIRGSWSMKGWRVMYRRRQPAAPQSWIYVTELHTDRARAVEDLAKLRLILAAYSGK